jgi:REP element-mobilizing transposase RayT
MLFGEIQDGELILNEFGQIVSEKWLWLETQYPYVELGAWIVMPNHFHGILVIHDSGRGGSRSALVDDMQSITRVVRERLLYSPCSVV